MSRQIQRDIDRHQGNIRNLENEIQRLEHFIGGKRSYLSSLKETLACESKELQMKEKLRVSSDLKWVSFVLALYSRLVKGTITLNAKPDILSDFHFFYVVTIYSYCDRCINTTAGRIHSVQHFLC